MQKECEIAGTSLPHGDRDVIAGRLREEDGIDWTSAVGIVIETADNTRVPVNDAIGVVSKDMQYIAHKPVSRFEIT